MIFIALLWTRSNTHVLLMLGAPELDNLVLASLQSHHGTNRAGSTSKGQLRNCYFNLVKD